MRKCFGREVLPHNVITTPECCTNSCTGTWNTVGKEREGQEGHSAWGTHPPHRPAHATGVLVVSHTRPAVLAHNPLPSPSPSPLGVWPGGAPHLASWTRTLHHRAVEMIPVRRYQCDWGREQRTVPYTHSYMCIQPLHMYNKHSEGMLLFK